MPTYEYLCVDCGNRKEVVQSFADAPLTTCEVCRGRLRKVIFPVGIQFKGSGFYSTDRRASQPMSRHNNKDKDKDKDSKGESSADTKSDKPEAKAGSTSDSKTESKSDSSSKTDTGSSPKKAVEKAG